MPKTEIRIYKDDKGKIPLFDWMDDLPEKVRLKCIQRIEMLEAMGHELRRPHVDYLKQGIYELRTKSGTQNYRVLFGYCGKNLAVVSHGIVKEKEVPSQEITLAVERLGIVEKSPNARSISFREKETRP